MKVNNINSIKYNKVQFGNSQKAKQSSNTDGYEAKVPANYDTARAYASYGINNTAKQNSIQVNDLSLNITKSKNNDVALVTIINGEPVKTKEGLTDIRQAILNGYIKALSNCGVTSVAFDVGDSSLIAVESRPKDVNSAIKIAKYLNNEALFIDKDTFEETKNDLKSYYKENLDNMKDRNGSEHFIYSEFKNAKSIDEVCEKLDNISYNDYLKSCENTLKVRNSYIGIDIPEKEFDNKQIDVKEIEKQVLNNTSINGKYEFEVK